MIDSVLHLVRIQCQSKDGETPLLNISQCKGNRADISINTAENWLRYREQMIMGFSRGFYIVRAAHTKLSRTEKEEHFYYLYRLTTSALFARRSPPWSQREIAPPCPMTKSFLWNSISKGISLRSPRIVCRWYTKTSLWGHSPGMSWFESHLMNTEMAIMKCLRKHPKFEISRNQQMMRSRESGDKRMKCNMNKLKLSLAKDSRFSRC